VAGRDGSIHDMSDPYTSEQRLCGAHGHAQQHELRRGPVPVPRSAAL